MKQRDKFEIYNYYLLKQAFDYNPRTGIITHRRKSPELFEAYGAVDPETASNNSRRWIGKRALNSWVSARQVLVGSLAGKRLSAVRVAWVLGHKGEIELPNHLTYCDGNPRNLKLNNIRPYYEKDDK